MSASVLANKCAFVADIPSTLKLVILNLAIITGAEVLSFYHSWIVGSMSQCIII